MSIGKLVDFSSDISIRTQEFLQRKARKKKTIYEFPQTLYGSRPS